MKILLTDDNLYTNTCPIKMPMQEENPDHSVNMADSDTLEIPKRRQVAPKENTCICKKW